MNPVFDSLPGISAPVGDIAGAFERLWSDTPAEEMRAMQLNLVLHFGSSATPDDANEQFRTTVRFSQRYPCRVIVLCPDFDPAAPAEIRAKIYGECSTGKSKDDTRCCEFVILHYTLAAREHLEDQVSVCLSTDLPLYYWAHRFASPKRIADYAHLLTRSARIIFDSAAAPPEAFTYPWPRIAAVRDLAYTRTLPLRQNLGQFLSRYDPVRIIAGLVKVVVRHSKRYPAEATCLRGWVGKGLARSGAEKDSIEMEVSGRDCPGCFAIDFEYGDSRKYFHWRADLDANEAKFEGDLGAGRSTLTLGAHLLTPEMALSEAMFF